MNIRAIYQRILFWIYCISMILYFLLGAMYPIETNYWLVSYGVPILIIEFISIFTVLFLIVITHKPDEDDTIKELRESGVISSKSSNKSLYGVLMLLFLMAFFFLYIYSIWIFIFFIAAHVIKYISFKQISNEEETHRAINSWGGAAISLLLSGLISAFFNGLTGSIFGEQISLMEDYQQQLLTEAGISGSVSFEVFIMWGIIYFAMVIFFDWFAPVWEKKTGKPFVRSY